MQAQALRLGAVVQPAVGEAYAVSDTPMASQVGSGALPVDTLPSHGLAIRAVKGGVEVWIGLRGLRGLPRPVIGRINDKTLWLDLRCLTALPTNRCLRPLGKFRVAQWKPARAFIVSLAP